MGVMYNQFNNLPFIPFNIVLKLIEVEDLWKILKYTDYDCLSKPNLSYDEKMGLIWKNQTNSQEYRVFLTDLIEDSIPDGVTLLCIYDRASQPKDHLISVVSFEFDILVGGKTGLIEYMGIPCSRSEVAKMLILQTLNGADINGVGMLLHDFTLSRWCSSEALRGNSKTYTGTKFVMATMVSTVGENNG